MNKFILSSAFLLLLASCSKNIDNSKPVIDLTHPYTQWQEVKYYFVGWMPITNGNILTITNDSTYQYNHKDLYGIRDIDNIGFLKSGDGKFSFISRDKKDTTTFYYTLQNDTLHINDGQILIEQHAEMMYKKVH